MHNIREVGKVVYRKRSAARTGAGTCDGAPSQRHVRIRKWSAGATNCERRHQYTMDACAYEADRFILGGDSAFVACVLVAFESGLREQMPLLVDVRQHVHFSVQSLLVRGGKLRGRPNAESVSLNVVTWRMRENTSRRLGAAREQRHRSTYTTFPP